MLLIYKIYMIYVLACKYGILMFKSVIYIHIGFFGYARRRNAGIQGCEIKNITIQNLAMLIRYLLTNFDWLFFAIIRVNHRKRKSIKIVLLVSLFDY